MNEVKCPFCYSTNVTVVASDQTREMVTIRCLACGQTADIDMEQFTVDTGDLPAD